MTTTTHIASACLITVFALKSGIDTAEKFLAVAIGSLIAHFMLDLIPHGFIAAPHTIFKKILPTLLELGPGPVILLCAICSFGHPFLFLCAAGFSMLPDIASTLLWKHRERFSPIPGFALLHHIHRKVHWFEKDNPDGTVSYRFPSRPLLALESFLIIAQLMVLFAKLQA